MTDLATRAMAVAVHSLGITQAQRLAVYDEGASEANRQVYLSAALVAKNIREDTMVDAKEVIMERVKTEGGVLYASSRPYAGILGWIGRVSLFLCEFQSRKVLKFTCELY